jgi:hypothetical protein
MTLGDHHQWTNDAANQLFLGGDNLWQAMCAEWAEVCLAPEAAAAITRPIHDALTEQVPAGGPQRPVPATPEPRAAAEERAREESASEATESAADGAAPSPVPGNERLRPHRSSSTSVGRVVTRVVVGALPPCSLRGRWAGGLGISRGQGAG